MTRSPRRHRPIDVKPWLKFFRVVNLPTVPGDVLAGAAVVWTLLGGGGNGVVVTRVFLAALSAVAAYLFGLADNDIVGAKTDGPERPIPAGEISVGAARLARGLCLGLVLLVGAAADLPPAWWVTMCALVASIVVYNRTKAWFLMGLCRGLNFLCGVVVLFPFSEFLRLTGGQLLVVVGLFILWTLSVAGITKYSEGEEANPMKRRMVGILIGSLIYLQLLVLVLFPIRPFLVTGAFLLLALRLLRRVLPEVSAS